MPTQNEMWEEEKNEALGGSIDQPQEEPQPEPQPEPEQQKEDA